VGVSFWSGVLATLATIVALLLLLLVALIGWQRWRYMGGWLVDNLSRAAAGVFVQVPRAMLIGRHDLALLSIGFSIKLVFQTVVYIPVLLLHATRDALRACIIDLAERVK
jgi:hypothetical protein